MPSWTNEFKVGLFVLLMAVVIVLSYGWSSDRVRADEAAITLYLRAHDADGLWSGSPIKLAGVQIGAIDAIRVEGDSAKLSLRVRAAYPLPVGSEAELRSSGLLGDRYIAVFPSEGETALQDGDWLKLRAEPGSFDEITRNVEVITEDVAAITKVVRELVENGDNTAAIESTLGNVEALTAEVRTLAERNSGDVDAIVDAVRRLAETLEATASETRGDLATELDKIQAATDTLQAALDDVQSITGKIDAGQGTIGALINDDTTVDVLNDTISDAGDLVRSFSGVRAEVYYIGRYYAGTQPTDPQFYWGNPLHLSGSNTIGLRLRSTEDFWYLFEIVDHPMGTVNWEEHYSPDLGVLYREYVREPNYRFTFEMEKRWGPASFRLGVKENGGGVGATVYADRDRLQISADLFDLEFGSFPVTSESWPNSRVTIRYEPIPKLFFEVGSEQLLLGLRYKYFTGFAGVGFHFDDDDIKLLFATLPLPL